MAGVASPELNYLRIEMMRTSKSRLTQIPMPVRVFLSFLFAFGCITVVLAAFAIGRAAHANHSVHPLVARAASAATSSTWPEQMVTASDGGPGDNFGNLVAVSGDTALVSTYDSGSPTTNFVYVFKRTNGTWAEVQKLVSDDPNAPGGDYGIAIAVSGTTALVGAPNARAVYVFTESGGTWTQTQQLQPSDIASTPGSFFGFRIALHGNTAIISAPFATIDRDDHQGEIYLFSNSGGTWAETQKVRAGDEPTPDGNFGSDLSFDGTTLAVAAFGSNVDNQTGTFQSMVYLFDFSGGTLTQTQEIFGPVGTTDPADEAGEWGTKIAIAGSALFVGAPFTKVGDFNVGQGKVYVYEKSGGTWSETQQMTASDGVFDGFFGMSMAASGDTAVVGGQVFASGGIRGEAYVLTQSGGTWGESQIISTTADTVNDGFAQAAQFYAKPVAYDGVTLLVGASGSNTLQGASYFYSAGGGNRGPLAENAALTTSENTAASGTLSASDPDGDALTFSIVDQPTHGSVTLDDAATGAFTYTPNANYSGSDSFTFKASDGTTDSNVATVSITVTAAANNPPVAQNVSLSTDENTAVSGTLSASDPDGDALTFSLVGQPTHGSVTLDDATTGAFTYTPGTDFSGADSFTFMANDAQADSNTATVSITVNASSGGGGGGGSYGGGATSLLMLSVLLALGIIAFLVQRRRNQPSRGRCATVASWTVAIALTAGMSAGLLASPAKASSHVNPDTVAALKQAMTAYKNHDFKKAISLLLPLARQGEPLAELKLGLMYANGEGVEKDDTKAFAWFQKAALHGDSAAQKIVADSYALGNGVAQDWTQARQWYIKAASQKDDMASYDLGLIYLQGKGVKKSNATAASWMQRAAALGNAKAQYLLGLMYMTGIGVPKDTDQGYAWFKKSAEQGNVKAQQEVQRISGQRPATADPHDAVQQGVDAYYSGDYANAASLLQPAAQQGNPRAQFYLGLLYVSGKGVARDNKKAFPLIYSAAEQGFINAETVLAQMYYQGIGVTQNMSKALEWMRKAANDGDNFAKKTLAKWQSENP